MMGMGSTTLMSLAKFERLDGPDHLELLNGELIRRPPAQLRHGEISERLYERLKSAIQQLQGETRDARFGKVHHEMGYLLANEPQSWLQPDVSLTHPDQSAGRYYEGAPLLAIEVVSPNDTAAQLEEKVETYLAHGAAEVWVIYPDGRHARLYYADGQSRRETKSLRSDLLPGMEIALDDIL